MVFVPSAVSAVVRHQNASPHALEDFPVDLDLHVLLEAVGVDAAEQVEARVAFANVEPVVASNVTTLLGFGELTVQRRESCLQTILSRRITNVQNLKKYLQRLSPESCGLFG